MRALWRNLSSYSGAQMPIRSKDAALAAIERETRDDEAEACARLCEERAETTHSAFQELANEIRQRIKARENAEEAAL
jgi:hypothetical protein